MEEIYSWCSLLSIPKVTFISNFSCKFQSPVTTLKPPTVIILPPGQGTPQLLALCKGKTPIKKEFFLQNNPDLLITFGRKGMQMGNVPIEILYSAEIHHLAHADPLEFFSVLKKFADSEQRNGR